jgi:hypothetical protein
MRVVRVKAFTTLCLALAIAAIVFVPAPAAAQSNELDCVFTAKFPVVLLRSGPGRGFQRMGFLRQGDTFTVLDQERGDDGLVWWKGENDIWVRSDMGDSNCPATCGNDVCEYGETSSSCAEDCVANTGFLRSTGVGCKEPDSDACYESISCYPECSECRCWLNEFGCVVCFCDFPGSTTATSGTAATTGTTARGCDYPSCDACLAAFPCTPGPCSKRECHLNEFGCPVCETAP